MNFNPPPRLSDEDIDYVLDHPTYLDHADHDPAHFMPEGFAQVRALLSATNEVTWKHGGYTNSSWNWYPDDDDPSAVRF